eukprot:gene24440-32889_t
MESSLQEAQLNADELQLQFDFARGECSQLLEEKEINVSHSSNLQTLLREKDEIIQTLETQIRELSEKSTEAFKSETVFTADTQVGSKGLEPTYRNYDGIFESILKEMDEAIHTHTASLLLGNEIDNDIKATIVSNDGKSDVNNIALSSGAAPGDLTYSTRLPLLAEKKNSVDSNKEFLAFAARIVEIRKYCADMLLVQQQRTSANLTPSVSSSVVVFSEVDDLGEQLLQTTTNNNPSTNSALPNALVNPSNVVLESSFEYTPGNENLELWEMREQVDKTDKTLRNVINDLQRAEDEKLSLERHIAELNDQLSQLQLRMDEKVRLNDKCSDRAMILEETCESLRSQNAVLHANIVTQQAQYSMLEANSLKCVQDLEISRQKLSQEHEYMTANSLKSTEMMVSLSRDLENNKKRVSQCEADMAAHSLKSADEIAALTRDLENTRKQLTQCQENAAVNSLKSAEEKELLSRDLDTCKKELSQCLAGMEVHSLKSAEEIAALTRDLENTRKQATQYQDNMVANSVKSAEENENLSLELERCKTQLSDMTAHSSKSAEEIETLTRDLDTCRKHLSQVQEKIVSNSLKSAEENEILSRDLENSKKELSQYQAEMVANSLKSAEENNALSRELENSKKQISQCQADITAAMGLSSDLTAKLQRQSQELKLAKEDNNRLKMDMEVVSDRHVMHLEDLKAQIAMKDSLIQSQEKQDLATTMASNLSEKVMYSSIVSAMTSRFGEETALRNASILDTYTKLEELQQEKSRLEADRDAAVSEATQRHERIVAENAFLAQGLQTLKSYAFRIASDAKALRNETFEAFQRSDFDIMRAQLLRAVALLEERTTKKKMEMEMEMETAALTAKTNDLKERDAEIARLSRSERVLSDTLKQKEQQLLQLMRAKEDALRLQEEASSKEIYDLQSKLSDAQDALRTHAELPPTTAPPSSSSSSSSSPSPREEALTKQLEDCQTSLQELRSALKATESKAAGLRKERDDTVAGLQSKIQKLEQSQKSNAAAAQAVSDELRITKESLARVEKEKVGSALQDQIHSLEMQLAEKSDHLDRLAVQYGEVIEQLAARHLAEATARGGGSGDDGLRDGSHADTQAHTSSLTSPWQPHSSEPTASTTSSSSDGHVAASASTAATATATAQEADASVGDSVLNSYFAVGSLPRMYEMLRGQTVSGCYRKPTPDPSLKHCLSFGRLRSAI